MNQEVRTRFAPSPTGFMHLGGLRAALYGYLFARKNGGKFILRIEDTDQVRFVEGATEVIYDTLRRCGMNWDEGPDVGGPVGPYIQSQRKDLYLPYAQQLVKTGHAYYCFCTKEELEERRAACEAKGEVFKYDKHCLHLSQEEIQRKLDAGVPYVIRQNAPTTGETSYDDLVFGHMTFPNDTLDDMVLIKQDGMPTYNFANVIDDHLMGITHVMRGMEYLSSTPKYNLLYEAFGWEIPQYIHMPPVMRDSQHKLSKRDGDAYFSDYVDKGLDATVVYDSKDYTFVNSKDYPIYIIASIDQEAGVLTFSIYGSPLEEGLSIRVYSTVDEELAPPEALLIEDPTEPTSYKKELTKARKGYRTTAYREYSKNGEVIKTEKLYSDTYKPVQGVYNVGTASSEPVPDPAVDIPEE